MPLQRISSSMASSWLLVGLYGRSEIIASKLSATDRAAGLVAGLAKGALVSVLLVYLLVILLPQDSRALRKSRAVPYAISAGYWLAELFPERLGEPFREKVRTVEKLRGNVFPFRK